MRPPSWGGGIHKFTMFARRGVGVWETNRTVQTKPKRWLFRVCRTSSTERSSKQSNICFYFVRWSASNKHLLYNHSHVMWWKTHGENKYSLVLTPAEVWADRQTHCSYTLFTQTTGWLNVTSNWASWDPTSRAGEAVPSAVPINNKSPLQAMHGQNHEAAVLTG